MSVVETNADLSSGPGGPFARLPRANVMLSAMVECFGGVEPTRHRVRDLSSGGVRIDQAEALTVGATVLVSVGALEAVAATVRWATDGSAGLAFAQPIEPGLARARTAVAFTRVAARAPQPSPLTPSAGWAADLQNPDRD